jgi:hypothetical protein
MTHPTRTLNAKGAQDHRDVVLESSPIDISAAPNPNNAMCTPVGLYIGAHQTTDSGQAPHSRAPIELVLLRLPVNVVVARQPFRFGSCQEHDFSLM